MVKRYHKKVSVRKLEAIDNSPIYEIGLSVEHDIAEIRLKDVKKIKFDPDSETIDFIVSEFSKEDVINKGDWVTIRNADNKDIDGEFIKKIHTKLE